MDRFDFALILSGIEEIQARAKRLDPTAASRADLVWVAYQGPEGMLPTKGEILHLYPESSIADQVSKECKATPGGLTVSTFMVADLVDYEWCTRCIEETGDTISDDLQTFQLAGAAKAALESGSSEEVLAVREQISENYDAGHFLWHTDTGLHDLQCDVIRRVFADQSADPAMRSTVLASLRAGQDAELFDDLLWSTPAAQRLLRTLPPQNRGFSRAVSAEARTLTGGLTGWADQWVDEKLIRRAVNDQIRHVKGWDTPQHLSQVEDVPSSFLETSGAATLGEVLGGPYRRWRDQCLAEAVTEWAENFKALATEAGPEVLVLMEAMSSIDNSFSVTAEKAAALWPSRRQGTKVAALVPEVFVRFMGLFVDGIVIDLADLPLASGDVMEAALALWDDSSEVLATGDGLKEAILLTTR